MTPQANKMTFSKFSFLLHIYPSRRIFLFLLKFHIFSHSEKSWGGQTKRQFSAKNDAAGQNNDFLRIFCFCCTSTHRDATFLFLSKFHVFNHSEKSWGGDKKNVNFRLKMTQQAEQITFFGFFFFCCTSSRRDETFLLLPKFHIFSRSEKSWGGQTKR